jgi:hypothetical protein
VLGPDRMLTVVVATPVFVAASAGRAVLAATRVSPPATARLVTSLHRITLTIAGSSHSGHRDHSNLRNTQDTNQVTHGAARV